MSKDFQPRQPKGIPIGGQFATHARGEGGVSLMTGPSQGSVSTRELDQMYGNAERHDALLQRGYVPPTFFAAVDDPHSTARRREWWAQHFASAEHDPGFSGDPKMPDNYTPSKRSGRTLSGRSLDGDLRTYRTKFTAGDVTIRMPSKASMNAYAKEVGCTFQVPYSAVDTSGRKISGWARVTSPSPGVWHCEPLGVTGNTQAKIAEAMTSRMESRRRSPLPRRTGDLLADHKARMAAQGVEMQDVRSTWMRSMGYDDDKGVLIMETSSGKTYGHHVPKDVFERVVSDRSPGAVYNTCVKGNPTAQVSKCDSCGRAYANANGHTCPPSNTYIPAPAGPKAVNETQRRAAEALAAGAQGIRQNAQAQPSDVNGGGVDPKAPSRLG